MTNLKGRYGITILGQTHRCVAQVDCYIAVLKIFHRVDPTFLPRLSQYKGRKLRLVAHSLEELHKDFARRPDFVNQFAHPILGSWWVWRDVNGKRVLRNIVFGCVFGDKTFGEDVIVDSASWGMKRENDPDPFAGIH